MFFNVLHWKHDFISIKSHDGFRFALDGEFHFDGNVKTFISGHPTGILDLKLLINF